MIYEEITTENFPDRRATTRRFADQMKADLTTYLEVVRANLKPGPVFGPLVTGGSRETVQTVTACQQLTAAYREVAKLPPFLLDNEMPELVEICTEPLRLYPLSYKHKIGDGPQSRTIDVRTPLKWILAHPDFTPDGLREQVFAKHRQMKSLRAYAIQFVALNFLVMRAAGTLKLFKALRFVPRTEYFPEYGQLPLVVLSAPAGTIRPPDSVISYVIRMADEPRIDEVLDTVAWANIRDPLAEAYEEALAQE